MLKEGPRKERPKSVYDNVEYSPNKPPSWQYYRCMSVVIKLFQLLFSGLVFGFAAVWVNKKGEEDSIERRPGTENLLDDVNPFDDEKPGYGYGPPVWVLFSALLSFCISIILFLCLVCCVVWMVKKASGWFCFEFFLHIFMIVLWFIASIVSIIYAVADPQWWVICACVFCFFAQLMYSVDCNMQFVYWRESKRRNIYKHSQPMNALQ